jgi:hypothetical protein
MSVTKPTASQRASVAQNFATNPARHDALRLQRIAHEEAQKAAGLWGEMSVGILENNGAAFVHVWKGTWLTTVYKLATKRPKEITKPEYEALCLWLKAGRYEGFTNTIAAWNVSAAEAQQIKTETISRLAAEGTRVINPPLDS